MFAGNGRPLTLNAELFALAAVTVTFAPLAVRVPEADPLFPTATLPTFSVLGATVSWPTAEVPLPESEMSKFGLVAFDTTVTVPLALEADWGLNVTVNVVL